MDCTTPGVFPLHESAMPRGNLRSSVISGDIAISEEDVLVPERRPEDTSQHGICCNPIGVGSI